MYFLASSSNGSASIYLVCICGMLVLQAYAHTCFACQGACLSVSACHNTPISRYCIRTAYVVTSSYSFATHFTALQQGTTLAALLSLHYPHTHVPALNCGRERLQTRTCHKLKVLAVRAFVYVCVQHTLITTIIPYNCFCYC